MRTTSVLAALLVAVVVPAQAAEAPAPKLAEFDKLVADWTAAMQAKRDEFKALYATEEYKAAEAAKDDKKLSELDRSIPPLDSKAFGTRAIELADQYAGDASVRVLAWATSFSSNKDIAKAIAERIEKSHLKSPKLGDVLEKAMSLQRGLGEEEANQLLERVIAESPHALPRAWAKYWQAQRLVKAKATKQADALFAEAAKLSEGTEHALRLGAPVFEKGRLQIGMEVPDIVGEDVDGVAFKLSDYRGKVVLIDYWGFW